MLAAAPAPNDRQAILRAKIAEADKRVIRCRRGWQAAQSRFMQVCTTRSLPDTERNAVHTDAAATYEAYLDAVMLKGAYERALSELRDQSRQSKDRP